MRMKTEIVQRLDDLAGDPLGLPEHGPTMGTLQKTEYNVR
jgi:hypothetical protein